MAEAHAKLIIMIRDRDRVGVSAYRSVIAALDNAGAQPVESRAGIGADGGEFVFAGRLGDTEVDRRVVTDAQVGRILDDEVAACRERADVLRAAGRAGEAIDAERQAVLIVRLAGQ